MNIFKSLSQGHGTISETNITSFLSFLLNSTNELDNSFLVLFFGLVDKNLSSNKLMDLLQLNQKTEREMIGVLSRKYTITAEPEYGVKKDGGTQIIDIFLKITNKKEETDVAYILIENKIKVSAAKKEQVSKQYEYFTNTDVNHDLPVYSILLTTDFDSFNVMHKHISGVNNRSAWLRWTNKKDKDNSVEAILRQLLILEQQANIQPINPNSQFIIKSFIDYIVTEFSNTATGEKNFNFNGSDEMDKATVNIDEKIYVLRRYENNMIRVFDEDDNLLDIDVLPLLKKINDMRLLNIPIKHNSGTPKNTQVFGREVIKGLNSSQVK